MARSVIRSLLEDGTDAFSREPGTIIWRDHNVDPQNRSVLVVESNEQVVIRAQGQIADVYRAGATNINSPNSGLSTSIRLH
jgi:hypothetical protein